MEKKSDGRLLSFSSIPLKVLNQTAKKKKPKKNGASLRMNNLILPQTMLKSLASLKFSDKIQLMFSHICR